MSCYAVSLDWLFALPRSWMARPIPLERLQNLFAWRRLRRSSIITRKW